MMRCAAHIIVCGVVQGVGYRYFAHRAARKLGLSGFVRNLHNGDVELEVEGERAFIEELVRELRSGPPSSHVSDLRAEWHEPSGEFDGFQITF